MDTAVSSADDPSSLSERTLGKRVASYLKNEAQVGRITRLKLQTLASVLGVASALRIDLDECQDGGVRRR
jgi:hypothetical protein